MPRLQASPMASEEESAKPDGLSEVNLCESSTSDSVPPDKKRAADAAIDRPRKKKCRLQKTVHIRPGFGEEKYDETTYYFENGLRKVYPYFYTYTTYCKGRWIGQKLSSVYAKEFRAQSAAEFARSIELGLITVNSEKVGVDYTLKNGDFIANKTHRHEVAVTSLPIQIIHSCEDFFVIDKPSSIPVHPCGRYRHNTVMFILGKENNIRDIKSIHRLDRLTSGLLIFGRTIKKARELEVQIRSRQIEKQYLCRVVGDFPSEDVVCDKPIDVISFKIGLCRVRPKGKSCKTTFKKLSFNRKSSVVLCTPHTGRMHQIRVHLQFLGYPIVNDPLYNHDAFGPNKGKGGDFGKSNDELIADLIKAHNVEVYLAGEDSFDLTAEPCAVISDLSKCSASNGSDDSGGCLSVGDNIKESDFDASKTTYDANCLECNGRLVFRDPKPDELVMYLHAWKYRGTDWEFESKVPIWAEENWDLD